MLKKSASLMFKLSACVLTACAAASAQSLSVTYPSASTLTPPLSQLPDGPKPTGNTERARRPVPSHAGRGGGPDTAVQTSLGPLISATGGVNFDGPGANGYAPSDSNIAVGPNHIFAAVNSVYQIYTKTGASLLGPKTLSSLWTGVGGGCASANAGDVVVQYDKLADRWILTQLSSLSTPYGECIAVSTSPDPTGTYAAYYYSFGSNLPDYPKFGVWPTATNPAYLATYNLFSNGASFAGAALCAYDRAAMIAGAANPAQICYTIGNDASYLPADLDGSTPPIDGTPGYFLTYETLSSLRIWTLAPNFGSPASSVLTQVSPDLSVASFTELCSGGTCVPQAGTANQLDSLADRPMYRLAYRNFGDHQAMVFNHSVTSGVRWYELQSPVSAGAMFSMFQQGTYAPDSNYRWMGSAAMDQSGDIAIGYSTSSSTIHPAVRYTGRVPSDTAGTLESEASIMEGTGSQTNGLHRWGDYSSLRIDPSDDCTFWYINEYLVSDGAFNWSTRVGSFKFTSCGQALASTATTLGSSPNPSTYGVSVTFTATVSSGTGTPTGSVTFKDGATTLGTSPLNGGQATLSTSSLAGGAHSITASFSGDSSHASSTSTSLMQTVNQAGTTTTLSSGANPSTWGQNVTFTATVSPSSATGTVQFTIDGSTGSPVPVSGGKASVSTSTLSVGPHSLTAAYSGDANYGASTSSILNQTVNKAGTTTTLTSSPNPSNTGQTVTFTATVSPSIATGSVTFKDGATTLGTVSLSSGKATLATATLAAGLHQVTANYGSDGNYNGSASGILNQQVNSAAADFSISVSPPSQTVTQGGSTTYTVTIAPANGFTGTVKLSVSGLPSRASGSFNPSSVGGGSGNSTLTISTNRKTPTRTYTFTVSGTSGTLQHTMPVTLIVN